MGADTMLGNLRKLLADQKGATAVEYGLIIALIVLAMMGALATAADKTLQMWNNVATEVLKS